MKRIEIRQIEHNSRLYHESVNLRYEILRKPLNLSFTEADLESENNQYHFVALKDEQVVGVLILKESDKIWKMRQVAVMESLQGSGIGARMVHFAEAFVREKSGCEITLNARVAAKNFYQNLKYDTNHEVFLEVGLPHVRMWKTL